MIKIMLGTQFDNQLKFIPPSNDTANRPMCDLSQDIKQLILLKLRYGIFAI